MSTTQPPQLDQVADPVTIPGKTDLVDDAARLFTRLVRLLLRIEQLGRGIADAMQLIDEGNTKRLVNLERKLDQLIAEVQTHRREVE